MDRTDIMEAQLRVIINNKEKEIKRLRGVFGKILEEDLQKDEDMYQVVRRMRHLAFEVIAEE